MRHKIHYLIHVYHQILPTLHLYSEPKLKLDPKLIEDIETKIKMKLPLFYRFYLEEMGNFGYFLKEGHGGSMYDFLTENQLTDDWVYDFPSQKNELQDIFIFGAQSEWGPWLFFHCEEENPDPAVFITETNFNPQFLAHRFSSYILYKFWFQEMSEYREKIALKMNLSTLDDFLYKTEKPKSFICTEFTPPEIILNYRSEMFYFRNDPQKKSMIYYDLGHLYTMLYNPLKSLKLESPYHHLSLLDSEKPFFEDLAEIQLEQKRLNPHLYIGEKKIGYNRSEGKIVILYLPGTTTLPASIMNLVELTFLKINNSNLLEHKNLSFHSNLRFLTKMEYLILTKSTVETLPEEIGLIPNLKYLRIIDNPKLKKLPDSICNLQHLEELRLENNHLEELPQNIGKLKNLKSLIVFHNFLTELPDTLGELTELEELSLWQNKVEKLPNTIGNLEKLYWLNATSNNLKTIPESIGYLKNLGHLLLTDNFLESVPQSLEHLQKIEKMDLGMNNLRDIPAGLKNRPEVITAGNLF